VELSPRSLSRLTKFLGRRFPLGQLAILHGFLTPAELGACLEEQRRSEGKKLLGAILVERRHATGEQLASLLEQQRQLQELDARGGLPATLEGTIRVVGRYVVAQEIGRGGTGVVSKAWDAELRRWVALKESKLEGEDARRRFLREARAAARLSHPNVVTVYDTGEADGAIYVVMELVEGKPLDEALKAPPRALREAVRWIAEVADGVHHAHEHGIVHRDLKPQNIVVSASGGPKVADFGLARVVDSETILTRAGSTAGTPMYMAPEQVDRRGGSDATPRTDVYALGAVLYEILTGQPPHPGESVTEIFASIVSRDPAVPRKIRPDVPRELETVALKALEKEPGRRYATAKAFAEDLRRFLAGEPVLARRPGLAERLGRRARKNPLPFGLGAAFVAVLAAAVVIWRGREAEREKGVRSIRDVAKVSLNAALEFRRVGANEKMRQYLLPLESAYREAAERAPGLAEPEYLMGRMHRALLDDERALEFQNRALEKDPRYAPALYERAVLLSKKYGREQARAYESLRALGSGPVTAASARNVPVPTLEQVERARPELAHLRESVVRDCTALEAGERSSVAEAAVLAARGILAYHRREYPEARRVLREAVGMNRELEEAWETLAMATLQQPTPGNDEKDRVWKEAEAIYSEAISLDRGYLPHLRGRGQVRVRLGNNAWDTGADPLPHYGAAEEDFTQALKLLTDDASLLMERGIPRDLRAQYVDDRGGDPFPVFAAAEADFTRALEINPRSAEALSARAAMRSWRGLLRMNRGEDPLADYAEAEKDLEAAVVLAPELPQARIGLGRVRTRRAIHRVRRGEDAWHDLAQAAKDLTEAIRVNPGSPAPWAHRAQASTWRALHRLNAGADPFPDFAAAEEDFAEALRQDPEDLYALEYRSHLRTERGAARMKRGEDPLPDFAKAEEDLAEMLKLYKGYSIPWAQRGQARARRGAWRLSHGEDPHADWSAAEKDLAEALRLNPAYADAWAHRGHVRRERAAALEKAGNRRSASQSYAAAADDYAQALRFNPSLARDLADPLKAVRESCSRLER